MKKILFINPTINNTVFGKMKMLALPPMGLGVLASRTPEKYRVSHRDENVDTIDFDARRRPRGGDGHDRPGAPGVPDNP